MEGDKAPVNLYDGHYSDHMKEAQTKVRTFTYGAGEADLGQSSWMTVKELDSMMAKIGVTKSTNMLEVGSGAGGTSVYIAKKYGCTMKGVDLNPHGVETGTKLAKKDGVAGTCSFQVIDASKPLPFDANTFDAVFCNDSMCHIPGRTSVLEDWKRVLKPGGKLIYTDAMVVSGTVSSDEFATRSSVGKYYYPCLGQNEKYIKAAGLDLVEVVDTTPEASLVAKRWHDSRETYKSELKEPEDNFQGLQKFLYSVYFLLHEARLSRLMYVATKK